LRRARDARGLSVAYIAGHLKVGLKKVEAIEASQWASLPPLPYLRGFVRNYAKLVQVDAVPLLAAIDVALGHNAQQEMVSLQPAPALDTPFFDRPGRRPFKLSPAMLGKGGLLGLGVVVLVVVIAAVVWSGVLQRSHPDDSAPSAVAPASAVPAVLEPIMPLGVTPPGADPAPGSADGRIEQNLPAPVAQAVPEVMASAAPPLPPAVAAPAPLSPGGGSTLVLHFNDQAWAEVRQGDGKVLLSRMNRAGTEQTLSGVGPFELLIGNPAGVTLSRNGVGVDLAPFTRQNVARVKLP
jgi:cytoskeleton protein RodZ